MASNSVVTPPAGFVLEDQPQPTQGVTPPTGFVLETSPAVQDVHATQPQRSTLENVAQGFGAGAADTLVTAGKIGSHIPGMKWVAEKAGDVMGLPKLAPGIDPYKTVEEGIKPAQQQATSTTAGKVGSGLEGLAEFITGDEALKGLGYGERLLKTGRIAKLIEEIPTLKRVFEIGLNAVRTGAVGTTQGLAHGESTEDALKSGAVAAGTGAAIETGVQAVKAAAPIVKKIAGERIPVRASQENKLANAAEIAAPSKPLERFDVNETQPAAKRAVGNIATEVKNAANERISPADAEAAISKLKAASEKATDLNDAAQQIKRQAKPIFEKLDDLTKDQDMKFSDWQKEESAAYRRGDIEAAKKAKDALAKILDTFKDQFDPKDLKNARANWRQASALQDIHDSLNTKIVVGPTPVELRPKGIPDPGYINGKAFAKQVLKLTNDGTLTSAGLTPEHIQALQELGTLLEKSANVHKFGQLARLTELSGAGLGILLHPAATLPAAKVAVPAFVASRVLGRVMTNAAFADGVVNVLRGAESVVPAVAEQMEQEQR